MLHDRRYPLCVAKFTAEMYDTVAQVLAKVAGPTPKPSTQPLLLVITLSPASP